MEDKSLFNSKDSMDISELASLNEDISPELIDQLQMKLSQDAMSLNGDDSSQNEKIFDENDDTTLFEEPKDSTSSEIEDLKKEKEKEKTQQPPKKIDIAKNFDDNFLKKYKAKLSKQKETTNDKGEKIPEATISSAAFPISNETEEDKNDIENLSKGKITEHKMTNAQKEYNDSLDFLDGNIKYSKYVIYINPENVDFINSLTVKERKNLINKILREQDDIAITKQRFRVINTVIKHVIITILTITVSIPIIYWTMNASLEATINNYRHSQSAFQTLYKKNGKITQQFNK